MPCDQRQLMTIDWAKADAVILAAAMEQFGLKSLTGQTYTSAHSNQVKTRPELTFGGYVGGAWMAARYLPDGQLVLNAADPQEAERSIRRAYGEQTVRAAAKRFGWNVQQDARNQQQFTVRRRA